MTTRNDLHFEERPDSPEQALAATYDQACAQYERAEKLEALLTAEIERHHRLQSAAERVWDAAQPFMDVQYKIVYFAVPGEAMDGMVEMLYEVDLATTWRTEKAQYQERIGRLTAALASARDAIRIVVGCELLDPDDSTLGQLRAVLADTAGQEADNANP